MTERKGKAEQIDVKELLARDQDFVRGGAGGAAAGSAGRGDDGSAGSGEIDDTRHTGTAVRPRESTGIPRASVRQTREGRCTIRGSPLWTSGTTRSAGGAQP